MSEQKNNLKEQIENMHIVLQEFLKELNTKINDVHKLEDILNGLYHLSSDDVKARPETWTEEHLIWKIMDALELKKEPQPYGSGNWPDFELLDFDVRVIGENKSINNIEKAVNDLIGINGYLNKYTINAEYGIATDGIEWHIYKRETGGDKTEFPLLKKISLRQVLLTIASENNYIQIENESIDSNKIIREFIEIFSKTSLKKLIIEEAPILMRESKKQNIDKFYDLLIELLFGIGKKHEYNACLINDIIAPLHSSKKEKNLFAVILVNRLLFIKFLEDADILPKTFLLDRLQSYEDNKDNIPATFYESMIKPLFYHLFNTDMKKRDPKFKVGWFEKVPYLNGGLFSENIPNEKSYDVMDRILPNIIKDLIEGHRLGIKDKRLDPSVLGSVFEKIINHIEQQKTQRDIGAYYTPNDVTDIIMRQTLRPKLHDVLVEIFCRYATIGLKEIEKKSVINQISEMSTEKILEHVENNNGWFGNPEAIKETMDQIYNIKILDAACGSGHFLTATMEEIHRIIMVLFRALHGLEEVTPKERYSQKIHIALNAIYGVDVEPIAVEIAKLRIWLKIVEGNGWQKDYGKLPNIEMNIETGNSLIGFPLKTKIVINIKTENIKLLSQLREQYKYDGIDKEEVVYLKEKIHQEVDVEYLNYLNYYYTTPINSENELENIYSSLSLPEKRDLGSYFLHAKILKSDKSTFTDDEIENLTSLGYKCSSKSARLEIKKYLDEKKFGPDKHRLVINELKKILTEDYKMEINRKPTTYDLRQINDRTFHWHVEFPELYGSEINNKKEIFDIVIGNPPYGDLLNKYEKMLINPFETSRLSEIASNFVEREIQLLKKGGYFGNVTTLGLYYDSNISEYHKILKSNFEELCVSCFERRPSQIFKNAQVQVGITTGKKKIGNNIGTSIKTSSFIRFNEKDRDIRLRNIEYSSISGLILRDRIGGKKDNYYVLPKIGKKKLSSILTKLKNASQRIVNDAVVDNNGEIVYRQRGGGYRPLAMLDILYKSSEISPIKLKTKQERNLLFLITNSSLFYLFWMVYGDARHVNTGQLLKFPFPQKSVIDQYKNKIDELTEEMWDRMKKVFDKKRNYIHPYQLKDLINKIDDLLADIYNLSDNDLKYIKEYDEKYIWVE